MCLQLVVAADSLAAVEAARGDESDCRTYTYLPPAQLHAVTPAVVPRAGAPAVTLLFSSGSPDEVVFGSRAVCSNGYRQAYSSSGVVGPTLNSSYNSTQ